MKTIVSQNEKIPFAIDKGELVRVFIIPSESNTQIMIMAHHLAGDGKSIIYFVKDIMNALSAIPLTYKPLTLLGRNLPQKGLSVTAELYARYCKYKWNKVFVLQFLAELPMTLIDAVLLNTYHSYCDRLVEKTARVMSYCGKNITISRKLPKTYALYVTILTCLKTTRFPFHHR